MNLYLKQKLFSLRDKFTVYDENENPVYNVVGKIMSLHNQHTIYNTNEEEVALIHKKILSFMPKFFIERPPGTEYEMKGKLAFAHEVYVIETLGWKLTGKFLEHDYTIEKDDQVIATIHQKWLSWGDTYEIVVNDGVDEVLVLAVILCIDIMHMQEDEASTAGAAGAAAGAATSIKSDN